MEKEKPFVYIDTNFSLSEILMLKLAFNSNEFEIVGISSVNSFMDAKSAALNILSMTCMEDLILPICQGSSFNLKNQEILTRGENSVIFDKEDDYLSEEDPEDFLYNLAKDCGRLDIIATGPLTNIGKAIEKYDDFVDYIDHIFILGSNFSSGDITKSSEFNFFTDPKAANIVLKEKIETFILPIDLSNSLSLPDEILKKNSTDPVLNKIKEIYKIYPKNERELKAAILLYMVVKPQAFIFEEKSIKVNEDFDRGAISEISSKNKKYVANRLNDQTFFDFLFDRLGV
ncbi:nucleoside hydrolase [Anaerococcus hydrogenalis]|uniref:Nucleoside hydrolase n=1 Tax=Anaerococcus hydrogenalis TaxID=33029 RepID=A0A2N6UHR5_9FIRM|nr:nucleoside hydrolase [Anaerococcus hydrogenalis]MDK7695407.1 nucleoside hydrolase [Anaerococcus hydrogenalis]MDK7697166.1 nucleoside hydrolase [Anaerococcus hydrogenalis]MDK7708313.1 nucleoside hydrolase [Anaerococcus hydrogenalis]PMC81140.1 nucleoside hydrolase [Anaerococcus hydrogenalis]